MHAWAAIQKPDWNELWRCWGRTSIQMWMRKRVLQEESSEGPPIVPHRKPIYLPISELLQVVLRETEPKNSFENSYKWATIFLWNLPKKIHNQGKHARPFQKTLQEQVSDSSILSFVGLLSVTSAIKLSIERIWRWSTKTSASWAITLRHKHNYKKPVRIAIVCSHKHEGTRTRSSRRCLSSCNGSHLSL